MQISQINIKEILAEINGLWYNPLNKNEYLFTANKKNESSTHLSVTQYGIETPINFNLVLAIKEKEIKMEMEGVIYQLKIEESPIKRLSIILTEKNIINLVKQLRN